MDMEQDVFAAYSYGQIALRKLNPNNKDPDFRLFAAGWLGKNPEEFNVMKVSGCTFRRAKSGPNKGKLCIPIPGTLKRTYISREELDAFTEDRTVSLATGHQVLLEELKADVEAAKKKFSTSELCFTHVTVEALLEKIESILAKGRDYNVERSPHCR